MASAASLHTSYRVGDFVAWAKDGTLDLNPNFQRRPVWKKGAKSFLIDTIIRGLPMPIIFLRDLRADLKTLKVKRDVVDGQQRIRSILSFIDPSLLKDFNAERDEFTISRTHNKPLGGKRYGQLDPADQRRILDYQFSVQSFPADTDDRLLLQIFQRMNATGLKLNPQELRNAEFFGQFKTSAYDLATEQLQRWRDDWRIFRPDQISRMNEVELTSELMTLIMDGVLSKSRKALDDYYKKYDSKFDDGDEVANRFRTTFDTIDALFAHDHIAELLSNRTTFFALFTIIYGLQYGGIRTPEAKHVRLNKEKAKAIRKDVVSHIILRAKKIRDDSAPPEVLKAGRGATSDASSRRAIIRYLAGKDNDPCPTSR